jgi:hypothetical protein
MSIGKLLGVSALAAATLALSVPTVGVAHDRDRYDRHDRHDRYDRVRYDRGHHYGRGHKVKVCHREWRHHHRVKVCRWAYR